ncbi:MAG: NAD(P)H-dependent oxidoreductase subunit E [bacterium]|nr:NAD(P)H-dependent oxidoreductase subunit E [bacterium]MDE0644509.1 NAD(P)H-dependent oxidoreductase subunit E [bacterium]MYD03698.1 NADH-quinone oxidoreductase subunit E [Acidimicrobiia bacterium]
MSALPTAAERAAVDGHLGLPQSAWEGGEERPEDAVLAEGGFRASQDRRQHILPTLHAVNDAIGWVSAGALNYICQRLLVPPAEAYGVAGFYALLSLEERPARVAHICDDVACRNQGGNKILSDLEGRSDVHPSPCLGQCDQAPAVFYQRAGEADCVAVVTDTDQVIKVLEGGKPEEVPATVPQAGDPALRLLKRIGRVDPTSLEDYRRAGGYRALTKAIDLGADQVLSEIKASNLRGRGGAAFPMGIKWEAVARSSVTLRYLICNADESEPGTFKDRVIMEGDPFALIESMTIAGLAIGAELGYLYIRAEYPFAQSLLENAIEQTRESGLLGDDVDGSGKSFDIEIRRGGGAYICGEETALMNSIEGHRGEPRNKPPFPTQAGLFGRPTVINNVETLINVPEIVLEGGDAFAAIGTTQSTGPKLFCLSGAVATPGVYEVEFGITLDELVDLAGGVTGSGSIGAIMLGGAAGLFVGEDYLDMPLTFEGAQDRKATLGSGVVMVFDDRTDFADLSQRIARFFRDESCGQCVPCRVGTVRQEELLARHCGGLPWEDELFEDIAQVMIDASICGLGHTASTAIRSVIDLGLLEGSRG